MRLVEDTVQMCEKSLNSSPDWKDDVQPTDWNQFLPQLSD